jgi:multidrug efflux system membrane fusion protein
MKSTSRAESSSQSSFQWSAGAVLLFCLILVLPGCSKEEEAPPREIVQAVKIMKVQAGQDQYSMSFPGMVRAAKRSELSFKVSGPLSELPIQEGQLVKKGDLVASILPRDFQVALNEAKAREVEAEKQYRRYKDLYAKKQVSMADFDRYKASRDVARAQKEDAANALDDTTLRAPFDGVIAKRYVENFEKVQAKQPIAFLQLIDQLEILINVPELTMARFRNQGAGHMVVEFDSVPGKQYPLVVKEFSTEADPATQTYQVVLVMDQPEEANILPGMTAKVIGTVDEDTTGDITIIIPALAVLNDADNKSYVWILDLESTTVRKTLVEVDRLEGSENIVIRDGLQGGETIVIAGVTKLQEGMKVRPWDKQRGGK